MKEGISYGSNRERNVEPPAVDSYSPKNIMSLYHSIVNASVIQAVKKYFRRHSTPKEKVIEERAIGIGGTYVPAQETDDPKEDSTDEKLRKLREAEGGGLEDEL